MRQSKSDVTNSYDEFEGSSAMFLEKGHAWSIWKRSSGKLK